MQTYQPKLKSSRDNSEQWQEKREDAYAELEKLRLVAINEDVYKEFLTNLEIDLDLTNSAVSADNLQMVCDLLSTDIANIKRKCEEQETLQQAEKTNATTLQREVQTKLETLISLTSDAFSKSFTASKSTIDGVFGQKHYVHAKEQYTELLAELNLEIDEARTQKSAWDSTGKAIYDSINSRIEYVESQSAKVIPESYYARHEFRTSDLDLMKKLVAEKSYAKAIKLVNDLDTPTERCRDQVEKNIEDAESFNAKLSTWLTQRQQLTNAVVDFDKQCESELTKLLEEEEKNTELIKAAAGAMRQLLYQSQAIDIKEKGVLDINDAIKDKKPMPLGLDIVQTITDSSDAIKRALVPLKDLEAVTTQARAYLDTYKQNLAKEAYDKKLKAFNEKVSEAQLKIGEVAAAIGIGAEALKDEFDRIVGEQRAGDLDAEALKGPVLDEAEKLLTAAQESVTDTRREFNLLAKQYNDKIDSITEGVKEKIGDYTKFLVADQAILQQMLKSTNPAVVKAGLEIADAKAEELIELLTPEQYPPDFDKNNKILPVEYNKHCIENTLPALAKNKILKKWLPTFQKRLYKQVKELKDQKNPTVWESTKFKELKASNDKLITELNEGIRVAGEIKGKFENSFDPWKDEFKVISKAVNTQLKALILGKEDIQLKKSYSSSLEVEFERYYKSARQAYKEADTNLNEDFRKIEQWRVDAGKQLEEIKNLTVRGTVNPGKVEEWFNATELANVKEAEQVEKEQVKRKQAYKRKLKLANQEFKVAKRRSPEDEEKKEAIKGRIKEAEKAADKDMYGAALESLDIAIRLTALMINSMGEDISADNLKRAKDKWSASVTASVSAVETFVGVVGTEIDNEPPDTGKETEKGSLKTSIDTNVSEAFKALFKADAFNTTVGHAESKIRDIAASKKNREVALVKIRELESMMSSHPLIQDLLLKQPFGHAVSVDKTLKKALAVLKYNFMTYLP